MERSHFDLAKIDETRIKKIEWYYDHLGSYKHSFVVMEAHQPCGQHCYFITEKDKLGVIWSVLQEPTTRISFNHDGSVVKRTTKVTKVLESDGLNLKLGDIKNRSMEHTKYDVL